MVRYAGAELDWTHVARELNTDLVVEGTIQKIGPKIRVMLQVCRSSDLQVIHSIRQDGGMDDLFGLQDRVSDSVSEKFVPTDRTSHHSPHHRQKITRPTSCICAASSVVPIGLTLISKRRSSC